jgi:hypothetical protein
MTKFGTKSNNSNLHASTDSVIASTSKSQPHIIIIHLEQEMHYKLQSQIYIRGGKEVCRMGWHQIAFSIQAYGKFKGKRKVNIGGLVDKKCQITFANTSTHDNEDTYDCFEDDSDPKCSVKLLWFMTNMCLKEQEHLFCHEAASGVKHRATSFAAKMEEAGTTYINILPNNQYGKNCMDKWVEQLCYITGVPPPLKGIIGNRGARGHGIERLAKANPPS